MTQGIGLSAKKPLKILYPAFILFFIFLLTLSAHALDVPKVQGYVNDYADMISAPAKAALENELKAFEQTDSTQIVILTIPSLEGEVIEDFGIKVAEAWKIGQKGKDNGVIFLVSKQDKKIRIEVGRGLEGPRYCKASRCGPGHHLERHEHDQLLPPRAGCHGG